MEQKRKERTARRKLFNLNRWHGFPQMKIGFLPIKKNTCIILAKESIEKVLFLDDSPQKMKLIAEQESLMTEQHIKLSGNVGTIRIHAV